MTADAAAPTRRSLLLWLLPTGLFALAAVGILWALPRPAVPCIAIYPPPPECAAGDTSVIIPFLVIIVLLYAALVACALLVTRARTLVLSLLTGALVLVFAVGVLTALSAASGPVYLY